MRVCSLRRLPASNWANAMRDMRSPPKTDCGLRLETEASCSPEVSSSSVVTTVVVPTSMASPKRIAVVSPRSTARMRPANVVTVTPAGSSRSAAGSVARTPGPTASGVTPTAAASCSTSEVWWCSSRGSATFTSCLSTPAAIATRPATPMPAPRIWKAASSSGGASCTVTASVGVHWQASRYPSRTCSSPSCSSSPMVGGGTAPATNFTRHDVHRPRPPHVAVTSRPAA